MRALLSPVVYSCLLPGLYAIFFCFFLIFEKGANPGFIFHCICAAASFVLLYSPHLLDSSAVPETLLVLSAPSCSALFGLCPPLEKPAHPRLPTEAFISGLGVSLISYPTPSHGRFLHSSHHVLIHRWWLLKYAHQTPGLIIMTPCKWFPRSLSLVDCQRERGKKKISLCYPKGILFRNVKHLRSEVKV